MEADSTIMILLEIGMWRKEAADKYCGNSDVRSDVKSQIECQSLCLETTTCVGISYTSEYPNYCYVCNDDELEDTYEFVFYRRSILCSI